MNTIISMAIRNIGRNRRRSLLAVISVALSILLITFMRGFIDGYIDSLVRNYTRAESGHIRITTTGFAEKSKFFPVTENIADPEAVVAKLRAIPEVAADLALVAQRISFGVLLDHDGNNQTAMAIAGDPQMETQLMMLQKSVLPGGRYLSDERDLIMGEPLAKNLGFQVGDTVKVVAQGSDYALNMRKFALVGIFKTGVNALDDGLFQISLGDAQTLLRTRGGVQQIFVFLDDYRQADATADIIRTGLNDPGLAVTSWTAIGPYYRLVRIASKVYGWIYFIIALLGAFIISNIMMMVVLERRREIGILKAIGFKRREILGLFFSEGVLLGCIGSVTGLALGLAANAVLGTTGIDFTKSLETMTMPIDNVIYPRVSPLSMVQTFFIGVAVSALVSVLPARQAARMNAVDAIKST